MDQLLSILGVFLIIAALLQMVLWTGRGLRLRRMEKRRFELELANLRTEIFEITNLARSAATSPSTQSRSGKTKSAASGFRPMIVERMIRECDRISSVYLVPSDGESLSPFQAGQHLTIQFEIPGQPEPVIRCYTISSGPHHPYYRITIKQTANDGLVSTFVNRQLKAGDVLNVRKPAGRFYIQSGDQPMVLLAGGIGITPMSSILEYLDHAGDQRECLLVNCVRNSSEEVFREHLDSIAERNKGVHILHCYSQPLDGDKSGSDYHLSGHFSVETLQQMLPHNRFMFFVCGPGSFMSSICDGLVAWGVPESSIKTESFGPASIRRTTQPEPMPIEAENAGKPPVVEFNQSQRVAEWKDEAENLLEFMEELGIEIQSGCRAGSCGTCMTRMLAGDVRYNDPDIVECDQGCILPCVARPVGAIEIDA